MAAWLVRCSAFVAGDHHLRAPGFTGRGKLGCQGPIDKEGIDLGQGGYPRRRAAGKFAVIGDQKDLASLAQNRAADADLLDIKVHHVPFVVQRRAADNRQIKFELADGLRHQVPH